MISKDKILEETRRVAKENGGVPLGRARFEKETGINTYDWGKYWARFGDIQREAGFVPNTLNSAYEESFLLESFTLLTKELGRIPVTGDLKVRRNNDPSFPDSKVMMTRFGNKEKLLTKVLEYAQIKNYEDVVNLCELALEEYSKHENESDLDRNEVSGEVYLFKSGKYYKIGKTLDTVRRGAELRIQLPEKMDLIHSIKTDDPSGIEAYWHKRFNAKRMNGEWFDLNASDVKDFKRWRRIF